jgi:hypothetical protein
MKCANCGGDLKQIDLFCTKCGYKYDPENYCPRCENLIDKTNKFCQSCSFDLRKRKQFLKQKQEKAKEVLKQKEDEAKLKEEQRQELIDEEIRKRELKLKEQRRQEWIKQKELLKQKIIKKKRIVKNALSIILRKYWRELSLFIIIALINLYFVYIISKLFISLGVFNLFIILIIIFILFAFNFGMIMLATKNLTDKKKKTFGILLLSVALIHLILLILIVILCLSQPFKPAMLIFILGILFCFLVHFIGGLVFLIRKEIKNWVRITFGILVSLISLIITILLLMLFRPVR